MTVPNPFKPSFTSLEQVRTRMTFVGIALLVLGVFSILAPIASTYVATMVIGVLLIAGGILRFVHGYEARHELSMFWLVVSSLFYVAAGFVMLWRPLIGSLSLTLVIGAFFLISGVAKAIRSYRPIGGFSGWMLFDGVLSVFLGILLLAGLPTTVFWALGVIVGVDLIMGGIAVLALSSSRVPAQPV
jgi:uncharacterized membrane protein HdeD (DUF308 family)